MVKIFETFCFFKLKIFEKKYLLKIFKKLDFSQNLPKISFLVKICQKFQASLIYAKILKNLNRWNFLKLPESFREILHSVKIFDNSILVKIFDKSWFQSKYFEKSRFSQPLWNFWKISISVKIL